MLGLILRTLIICTLYTGELFVITDLFMSHAKRQWKRCVGYGAVLVAVYSYLIYRCGLNEEIWYIGVGAIILNNFLHQGKLKTRIWVFFITYAISAGGEGIVCILLNQIYEGLEYNGANWILDDVIPHVSALLVAMGVNKVIKRAAYHQNDLQFYDGLSRLKVAGLILIGIIYTIVFNMISIIYIYKKDIVLGSTIIFFGIYFTLCLIIISVLYNQFKLKKEHTFRKDSILKHELKKQIHTYNHLEEKKRASEQMKQELKKEMEELIYLMGDKEKDHIMPYIERIKERLEPRMAEVITGNEVIDAILHEKSAVARGLNIEIESNVSIPSIIELNIVDLCIIIDCTMDYMIKVCHEGNKNSKQIKVKGIWFKGYLIFEIWCTLNEEESAEIGYAKIPDELEVVIKCLDKYDGNLKITKENQMRKIELSLNTVGGVKC